MSGIRTCVSKTSIRSCTAQVKAGTSIRSGAEDSVMSWHGSSVAEFSAVCAAEPKVALSPMMPDTVLRKLLTVLTSWVHCVMEAWASWVCGFITVSTRQPPV